MATMFIKQSGEYVDQINAEVERLEQLRDQVQRMIQSEELDELEPETPRRRAAKKSAGKKTIETKAPVKRGRPKSIPTTEA